MPDKLVASSQLMHFFASKSMMALQLKQQLKVFFVAA